MTKLLYFEFCPFLHSGLLHKVGGVWTGGIMEEGGQIEYIYKYISLL